MVTTEWRIAKSNHTCKACSTKFKTGDAYFSALADLGSEFERSDFCPACFQERRPENVFSYWKSTVSEDDEDAKPKAMLDVASVLEFFRRLAGETDPQRVAFRYVLALMLTRKKVLRLKGGSRNEAGADVLVFVEGRAGESHEVIQPALSEDEVAAVSSELGRLLGVQPAVPQHPAPQATEAAVPPAN